MSYRSLYFLCALAPFLHSAESADAARGRTYFQQNCALCHDISGAKQSTAGQGPSLAGIMGHRAATLTDFGYSKALRASGLTWNASTLNQFLANPSALVPGTLMLIAVPIASDRADLISFLSTLAPAKALMPPAPGTNEIAKPTSSAGDWRNDGPGVRHNIDLAQLPEPYATESAGNGPHIADRPAGAHLSVPAGFKIELFASGLSAPRLLRVAPNGDIFIAETATGRIRVLRAADGASAPSQNEIFADHLRAPFGIAFYPAGPEPQWIYIANINSVVRFPYRNGDLAARGKPEVIVPQLSGSTGGHTTRDIAFSADGRRMFISVGSGSNVAEGIGRKSQAEVQTWEAAHGFGAAWKSETSRADILVTDPEGRAPLRTFATGIRNAVGLAIQPVTGELWCSTNERDGLGDDLVPDYITSVREGGYYGWPWYYMGNHEDPRHAGARPDLAGRAIVPDVPLQAHSASLEMMFYPADTGIAAFPAEYHGDIFAALHGSWNRATRTGNKVIRVHLENGKPTGGYEDFVTGFVIDNRTVWGRPVGVAVAHDGALLITDDASDTIWRVAYIGSSTKP
ncbi:MAG: sorbosone dehydrogenase [Verrucomicrobia bacterium]|nr:sorbosone dehydrogenase [Verrucomicrobiota bacterium]